MKYKIKTSVITPVFKESIKTLRRSVDSALSQGDVEVILISDDQNSYQEIASDRIQHLSTGGIARGPSVARNIGIKAARGNYITFLDSDDTMLPGKLDAMVPLAEKYGIAISDFIIFHEYDHSSHRVAPEIKRGFYPLEFYAEILNPLIPVFRADTIHNINYMENIRFSEDSSFNFHAILNNNGAYWLDVPLHKYFIKESSLSHKPESVSQATIGYMDIINNFMSDNCIPPENKETLKEIYKRKIEVNEQFGKWKEKYEDSTFQEFIVSLNS